MTTTDEMTFVVYPIINGVVTIAEQYMEDEAEDPKAFLSKAEAWAKAKTSSPKVIEVMFEQAPAQTFYAEGVKNEAPKFTAEVGKVYTCASGLFRVKQSKGSGRHYAERWNGEEWEYTKGAIYNTEGWRPLTAEEASDFGHKHNKCVFCYKKLSTVESTTVGYGPICAGNNNLPWGEKK